MAFRQLKTLDVALLAGVGLIWLASFTLHVGQVLRGELAWVPTYVTAAPDADSFPTVRGFWNSAERDAPGLAIGDRLLAVGSQSLEGAGNTTFDAHVYAEARASGDATLHFERNGIVGETELQLIAVPYAWRGTILSLALGALGVAVLWHGRGKMLPRWVFLAFAFWSLYWCYFFGRTPLQTYAGVAVFTLALAVAFPAAIRAVLSFPAEVARRDRWSSVWPWVFALNGPVIAGWAFGFPPIPATWAQPLALFANVAAISVLCVLLAGNYHRSSPAGRRQLRWVMLGIYLAVLPPLLAAGYSLYEPTYWRLFEVSQLFWLALPICAFIAIDRYDALDVDRLISAAATATVFSIGLTIGFGIAAPYIATAASGSLGVEPIAVQSFVSAAAIGLVIPVHRQVRRRIDRLLFTERDALAKGASAARDALAHCKKPDELFLLLGAKLTDLLHPDCSVLYEYRDGAYLPMYVDGPAVAPPFDAEGSLSTWLGTETGPIGRTRILRAARQGAVTRIERAALDSMAVEVLIPIVMDGSLTAFVCLSGRHSGDVYTATDLVLLSTIVDRVLDLLSRFEVDEERRKEHEIYDRVRRYVPDAVAEHVAADNLGEGEFEVTVLFVDIRGYTSLSEGQNPEAIFSVINRYTTAVSTFVKDHGGVVVEFNGDGMMAVFGAPDPLEHKEIEALHAAREIVEGVRSLSIEPGATVGVGVGIATGPAFVGSIHAVDRLIWSAIGNTTNLASRLEGLTRELDADVVFDVVTQQACGHDADDCEIHEHYVIRGRQEPIDIYALPRNENEKG